MILEEYFRTSESLRIYRFLKRGKIDTVLKSDTEITLYEDFLKGFWYSFDIFTDSAYFFFSS